MLKANIPMLMLQFILSENSSGHRTVDRVVRGRIHFPGVHIVLSHDKSRDITLIFLSGGYKSLSHVTNCPNFFSWLFNFFQLCFALKPK